MIVPHNAYRHAFEDLVASQRPEWAITSIFNGPTSLASGQKALRGFHARLDRALLGRNWQRQPAEQRSFCIWQPEHIASNLHYHGCMRIPQGKEEKFLTIAQGIWKKLVPSGAMDINPITDISGWAHYITKEAVEGFIISTEFSTIYS